MELSHISIVVIVYQLEIDLSTKNYRAVTNNTQEIGNMAKRAILLLHFSILDMKYGITPPNISVIIQYSRGFAKKTDHNISYAAFSI